MMTEGRPKQILSQLDVVSIIVGIVIGAGIFRLPSLVAANVGVEWAILAVWVAGGVISLMGALCFAELVSAHPNTGGEYHFLTLAYGRNVGFMFAWARMTVVQTGSIAMLSFVLGDYAVQILPLGTHGSAIYAAGSVVLLTALNVMGIRETKGLQNILFALTMIGVLGVVLTGFFLMGTEGAAASTAIQAEKTLSLSGVGLAMVFVLLTYGGWNESAYVSAEVAGGRRGMVRPLVLSIAIITAVYLLINIAYLGVLGVEGMAASRAVGRDVMHKAFGEPGGVAIALVVIVVVLASINVTILTGARTNFALGRDFPLFKALAFWHVTTGQPTRALLVQGAIALLLVGLGALDRGGVETMIDYMAPVFWFFFLLVGLSLFVLRRREPLHERPFLVPFYPVTPIFFCLSVLYLLYASLNYTGVGAAVGVSVLALGLPLLYLARRKESGDRGFK